MGRNFRIEYDIPSVPNQAYLYACINPTCRTHFVLRPTPGFDLYAELGAADFGQRMDNLVTDEEPAEQVSQSQLTKHLHCVFCNDKVGLRLTTYDRDLTVSDERDLLLVNKLVVFCGRPQPQPMMEFYELPGFNQQANPEGNPQADPQANPQAEQQALPQADLQADQQAIPQAEQEAHPQADLQAEQQAHPQVDPQGNPQADPQGNPQAHSQANPHADPQADLLQPPSN